MGFGGLGGLGGLGGFGELVCWVVTDGVEG